MKQIFTLITLGALCLSSIKSSAQIVENFDNASKYLSWQFRGANVTTSNAIAGAGSLDVIPTNSGINTGNSNSGYAISPLYTFTNNGSISFSYLLHDSKWKATSLANNAIRRISVSLISATGIVTPGPYVDLIPSSNASGIITMALPALAIYPSLQKIQLEFLGNGDGNSYLAIDDLNITTASLPIANSILPLHVTLFSANVSAGKVQLNWTVAENETGDHFEIEKSKDGKTFHNAAILFTTDKNGTEAYSYRDAADLATTTYYRLKMVNKDNSTSYSKVVYVKNTDAAANKIVLLQNPVQNTLSFSFPSATNESNEIAVYNMAGVKVYSQYITTQKGINTISLGVDNNINKGNYILQVSSASGRSNTQFVKL